MRVRWMLFGGVPLELVIIFNRNPIMSVEEESPSTPKRRRLSVKEFCTPSEVDWECVVKITQVPTPYMKVCFQRTVTVGRPLY